MKAKKTQGQNNSPCIYKISLTAVFSKEIDKEMLSDAVFECLREKTEHLSLVNVNSIVKCRGDAVKKVKEEVEIATRNPNLQKTQ